MAEFVVQQGDVRDVPSDLLLLKHAQAFFGADGAVANRLLSAGLCTETDLSRKPGEFVVVETKGTIQPKRVMFLGTPGLHGFTYDEMQRFARTALEKLARLDLPIRTLTTTVHGTGYGLDGGEALQRLVLGFREGLSRYRLSSLERIIFLTLGAREERMLAAALGKTISTGGAGAAADASATLPERELMVRESGADYNRAPEPATGHRTSGRSERRPSSEEPAKSTQEFASIPGKPVDKRRVFVAMPFAEAFENVYEFGIYPAVRNCGLICERVDEAHFTGDVLARIRDGIESASLVIADLSEGRPNVYLEVGYAWGKGIPVIFVAQKGEQLHFDVSTHRCLFYGRFAKFAEDLEQLIRGIDASRSR